MREERVRAKASFVRARFRARRAGKGRLEARATSLEAGACALAATRVARYDRRVPSLAALVIRPMRADDGDFVVTLSAQVFGTYSWDPVASTLAMLDEPGAVSAVAEVAGSPAGFVVVRFDRHAKDFGPLSRPVLARVNAIAVRPELFGRGIGRRLLAHAEELARARRAVSMSLLTARANMRARRLFTTAGFLAIAPVANAYARRQSAIAMIKPLTAAW
jgi:ribosomal protein S18 acetylase RimI-like enzyme